MMKSLQNESEDLVLQISRTHESMVELVDTLESESNGKPCEFESHYSHQILRSQNETFN